MSPRERFLSYDEPVIEYSDIAAEREQQEACPHINAEFEEEARYQFGTLRAQWVCNDCGATRKG